MNQERKLIEDFFGPVLPHYPVDWGELMRISEYICKNFTSVQISEFSSHTRLLLGDLREYIRGSLGLFDKTKTLSCIIDFINAYNLIDPDGSI